MKTFGELVTQIKRGLIELCDDLNGPGAAQALGPAHAYGKSFLILQSVRTLQEAIQKQETHLKALVGKEGAPGSASQSNDTKTWRVVDSIYQSLSLIDRYRQDPSRYTHHGIAEWLKQEATNSGLSSDILPGPNGKDELNISGNGFLLELLVENQEKISSARLTLSYGGRNDVYDLPEIVEFFDNDNRSHMSHLFSIAARLDSIEKESHESHATPIQLFTIPNCPIDFKMSLGGLHFPFADKFEALLTYDYFEQNHHMPMIVVDPPIIFPVSQLKDIQDKCGIRFNIEFLVSSTISQMIQLKSDVYGTVGGKTVRLILNDNESRNGNCVHSVKLARLPLGRPESFPEIISILKKAALWCSIIIEAFSQTEEDVKTNTMVDIAPMSDFSLAANYWVGDRPAHIRIRVSQDGALDTDNDQINSLLTPDATFPDIISAIIQ
ncbi:hypothetical protein TVAG_361440 [Trichomonas vaginalis G3]|uniref:Uncharacterized protein n=1 Tax=Trichomonas vaginalis (strain ATCC PRA-98 / G3) TaxID=412133 RepID=A2FZR1_TRIV3|nr:hypothetical protein TVAGG3_0745020 [Trichomonas vaginalis G3]EAX89601.1 hypothetical protein TVAG_361440 [Trichomonas vaginalis G3]KAI5512103.1 hypothetical protein TVAGG3_0745020 [Trichomonas vaginalis G3]|eukprot:XP_001302531.1 hypothetical protein [Trichomonas vaginalis G3]